MNRKATMIKPFTREEVRQLSDMTGPERVKACNPATPQGFVRFYTYYYHDSINFAHADFHYDVMEALWILIQSSTGIKPEHKSPNLKLTPELMQFVDEVLYIGFRECAKTTMFKAFVQYIICYELRRYINVDAYDKTNSERILFDLVFNMQTNTRLRADFGELYTTSRTKDETDQKRITDFLTNKIENANGDTTGQIRVEAHSTGTPVRGRQHNNKRPDFLWLEDFETEDTIVSEAKTDQIARHIASFKGGLADTGNWILCSANYISEYGNVQSLIDKSAVSSKMLSFIIPIYTEDKEITWKSKYLMTDAEAVGTGKVSIQSKKEKMWTPEKGDQSFITEMLCKPIDYATQEFTKDKFKYITWDELNQKRTVLYITIDSGGSSKETQRRKQGEVDDTGVVFNFIDEFGNWHIKAFGRKMDAMEIMEMVFAHHNGYKTLEYQAIEETMFVEAIKPFYDQAKRDRQTYPNLKMLKAGGRNKENRIRGLIPRMEAGTCYFIKGECDGLEEQLLRFPRAKHDDIADALAYQNDVARTPKFDNIVQNQNGFYENEEKESPFSAIGV